MFNKKDYLSFFNQLYSIELTMKKEMEKLLKLIDDVDDIKILKRIRSDEIHHAEIVKSMINLIK